MHFTYLATRKLEFFDLDCTKYGARVEKLRNEFANRFSDLRQNEIKLTLVTQIFDLGVADCPEIAKWNSLTCRLLWKTKGNILKKVW